MVTGGKSHYSGLCVFGAQDVKATISAYAGLRVKSIKFGFRLYTTGYKGSSCFCSNWIHTTLKAMHVAIYVTGFWKTYLHTRDTLGNLFRLNIIRYIC